MTGLPSVLPKAALGVLGAGSFGTALAIQSARRDHPTLLWGRAADKLVAMESARVNAQYLPDCPFPARLHTSADLAAVVAAAEDIILGTPSHTLRATCELLKPLLRPEQGIVAACKGLEPGSGKLIHEVVAEVLGSERRLAVLSGPTFAKELAMGLPTAVTIASTDLAFAEKIAQELHGDGFRAYTAEDVIGVEIGGAAKNIFAIGVGIADGLGLGANTRAGFITRSLNEIMRLGEALGADKETLMGLSGLGDLVLTCTDNQSRNRRMGLLLAQGRSVSEAIAEIQQVVEGIKAAPEVLRRAHSIGVDLPITEQINRVLQGEISPLEAVRRLATRPQRAEQDSH
jgi:glycerol-3-phosphate dehydrogenase (NAD(P)+)